jgi:putative transposase
MSTRKVKKYQDSLKSKIILEVLRGEKTINEIGSEFKILPCNIKLWKKIFLENIEVVFNKDKAVESYKEKVKEKDEKIDELYKMVGKLQTETEWLKKKIAQAGLEY